MAYGRIFTAVMDGISISAVSDIFWVQSGTGRVTVIHGWKFTQSGSTTSAQLPIKAFRTATDNSANGTGVTANPTDPGGGSYNGTIRRNITGGSLSTETTVLYRGAENVLSGWEDKPTPAIQHVLRGSADANGRWVLKLVTAPASALTMSCTLWLEEIG